MDKSVNICLLLSCNLVITKDTSQKIKTKGFVNHALSIFLCQSWQRLFFKAALLCKSLGVTRHFFIFF